MAIPSPTVQADPRAPRKILVIALAGIGDALCAMPLIEALRHAFPQSQIDALVMWPGGAELLGLLPALNQVFQYNMIRSGLWRSLRYCRTLRRRRYDLSLNTYPQSKGAYRWVARFIAARRRLSHRYPGLHIGEGLCITDWMEPDVEAHLIENNLRLLDLLGLEPAARAPAGFHLPLRPEHKAQADRFLEERNLGGRRVFGVHTGSGSTKNLRLRRWPEEHYREFLGLLLKDHSEMGVLLFGGPEERETNLRLEKTIADPAVAGVTSSSLATVAALVGRCEFFLSVDTALMHVAAAMKVPHQIVIRTPTFNRGVEPYRRPYLLVGPGPPPGISYAFDGRGIQGDPASIVECMRRIKPGEVYGALASLL